MTVRPHAALDFQALPGRASADPFVGMGVASSVRVVRLRRSAGRRAHSHPRSEEILYVVRGSGEVWIDGTVERIGPGDVVHIPPAALHATLPDPDSEMELVCFFPDDDLASNLNETDVVVGPTPRKDTP